MTLYKCSYCDYSTDYEYRWNKHILSKKHISKKYKCDNNFEDINNILNGISNSSGDNKLVKDFFNVEDDNIVDIENNIELEINKDNILSNINKDSNFTEIPKDNKLTDINFLDKDNLPNDINESNKKNEEETNDKINLLNNELECYKRKYNTTVEELNKLKNKLPEPEFQNYTTVTSNNDENIKPIFITDSNIDDTEINRIKHSINKLKEIGKYKYYKLDDINFISNNLDNDIKNNIERELNIIEIDAQKSYDLFDPFLSINNSDNDN